MEPQKKAAHVASRRCLLPRANAPHDCLAPIPMNLSAETQKLIDAAKRCDSVALRQALREGASHAALSPDGRCAMSWVLEHGSNNRKVRPCVEALLRKGDARYADADGVTPLMHAAADGMSEIVALLLPHSDPLAQDDAGATALMHASYNGFLRCVELLLPVSDPNAKNQDGDNALMQCCSDAALAARVGALLASATDVSAQNGWGETALFLSVRNNSWGLSHLLLAKTDTRALVKNPSQPESQDVTVVKQVETLLRLKHQSNVGFFGLRGGDSALRMLLALNARAEELTLQAALPPSAHSGRKMAL